MPLTPEDVRTKRFTPVRLREGYDMGEVDQFLDEVESELERLSGENDDLRTQVATATDGASAGRPAAEGAAGSTADTGSQPPAAPTPVPATVGEASSAAARLLEIATRNADEVVTDAKERADTMLGDARTRSERLDQESQTRAHRIESDARARAEKLDSETGTKRQELFVGLEQDRDSLAAEVEHLRDFEREYRSRLKSYFSTQLAQLEGEESAPSPLPGDGDHTPRRLRFLLGDDADPHQDHDQVEGQRQS